MNEILRLDSNNTVEEIKEAIGGESRPKIIVIGLGKLGSMEGMKASMIAAMLHECNLPILVGDTDNVSDEDLLDFAANEKNSRPRLEDLMSALLPRKVFEITATPIMKETYIDVHPKQKAFKENNKHRRNHFNKSQNQNFKGRK